ncbi:MAG: hypothetical protein U1E83_05720 [Methylotetracoccus sp.]
MKTILPLVLLSVGTAVHAASPQYSDWGYVTQIATGWADDTMAVYHTAPLANPSGCGVVNAGYATSPADPGHKLFHATILGAYLAHKQVAILALDCVYDKPRILGVNVKD